MWKHYLVGFAVGLIALPLAALLYLMLGLVPVATTSPPMPLERFLARTALHAKIRDAGSTNAPIQATESNLMDGATLYRDNCAVCHGLPGQPKTAIAAGMFPEPPVLLEGEGVTDDPVGHTYWVVKNGIRLTGMPGWGKAFRDDQIWQLSLLLANAHSLPDAARSELQKPAPIGAGDQAAKAP